MSSKFWSHCEGRPHSQLGFHWGSRQVFIRTTCLLKRRHSAKKNKISPLAYHAAGIGCTVLIDFASTCTHFFPGPTLERQLVGRPFKNKTLENAKTMLWGIISGPIFAESRSWPIRRTLSTWKRGCISMLGKIARTIFGHSTFLGRRVMPAPTAIRHPNVGL